jgi:hypothetical protein
MASQVKVRGVDKMIGEMKGTGAALPASAQTYRSRVPRSARSRVGYAQQRPVAGRTMSEASSSRTIDYARLSQLSEEFTQHWERLQALYLDAIAGFAFVLDRVESEQAQARAFVRGSDLDSQEFQDTRMFTYEGMFSEDFCTSGIHRATQGEKLAKRLELYNARPALPRFLF